MLTAFMRCDKASLVMEEENNTEIVIPAEVVDRKMKEAEAIAMKLLSSRYPGREINVESFEPYDYIPVANEDGSLMEPCFWAIRFSIKLPMQQSESAIKMFGRRFYTVVKELRVNTCESKVESMKDVPDCSNEC